MSLLLHEIQGQRLKSTDFLLNSRPTPSRRVRGTDKKPGKNQSGAQYSYILEGPVVVVGNSLHQVHLGPGDAADGPVPVVSDPHVQVPGVKVLKILIEGHKILQGRWDRVEDL